MSSTLRLMCVLAHPDDESLGVGGTIAKYSAEGIETYLVTATRGEKGWFGAEKDYPGPVTLGRTRQAELLSAAQILGLRQVYFLDYIDGELDKADTQEAVEKITHYLRLVRPQVVITFGPEGSYGHPDHIAISQLTTAATVSAADCHYADREDLPPHRISKLYYMMDARSLWESFNEFFGEITMNVGGIERRPVLWEDWAITTRINGDEYWRTALSAILCHESQLPSLGNLHHLNDEQLRRLFRENTFYRAFSLVQNGHSPEGDLFEGLRR